MGLGPTLRRLRGGRIGWLALGVGPEAFSMLGDIVMLREAFVARRTPVGWRRTADIRMAGAAATKLLAAAGSGGIALTVWTLRGWGPLSMRIGQYRAPGADHRGRKRLAANRRIGVDTPIQVL